MSNIKMTIANGIEAGTIGRMVARYIEQDVEKIETENTNLKLTMTQIRDYARKNMGRWSEVRSPYLPADMEHLADIADMAAEALKEDEL